jgi:biopolymer transport protein ExbD
MNSLTNVCVLGSILMLAAGAQEPSPPLRKGVSVRLPVASHVVETPAADAGDAVVVAITAKGMLFAGAEPTTPAALGRLGASTVYVKADAGAPFQTVLTVLDALHGRSVVLLAAPPRNAVRAKATPPYGMKITVAE